MNVCGYVTPATGGASIAAYSFSVNGGAPISVWPAPENQSSGFVSANIPLRDGDNDIQLMATDSNGRMTMKKQLVVVDRVAPVITILSPTNEAIVDTTINVTSQVDDVAPTRVVTRVVNTTSLPVGGGIVTAPVTFGNSGYNTIKVEARDAAGNVSAASIRVWVK